MEISHKEILNVHRPSLKVSLKLVKIMKFHKNLSGWSRCHPCGQTGRCLKSLLPIVLRKRLRKSVQNKKKKSKLTVSAFRTNYDANCQHERFEPIMTQTDGIGASNQLRRKLSASAFWTNYDANWRYRRFEPITTQTVSISASNQLWRKLTVSALRTKYDANCQHQRFEPIMTQNVRMSAPNKLRRKLTVSALRTNYDEKWQHRHFEPFTTNFPHIKYVSRIWNLATDILTSQSYLTGKWNNWKLNKGGGGQDEVCKAVVPSLRFQITSTDITICHCLLSVKRKYETERTQNVTLGRVRLFASSTLLRWSYHLVHWCHTLLLFTNVQTLQKVITIIRVFCFISLQNLLTCRRRFCPRWIYRST